MGMAYLGRGAFVAVVAGGLTLSSALGAPGDVHYLGADFFPNGINNAGQVAGFVDDGWGWRAYVYIGTPGVDGQLHDLGSLDGDDGNSAAYAISNAGHIVGETDMPSFGVSHAMIYTGTPGADGQMVSLGALGGDTSYANDVNDLGQVVGEAYDHLSRSRAFLYSGGQMHDLGTLGGVHSWATSINNAGQIAGFADNSSGDQHAFLYTGTPGVDGAMQDLGTLPGGSVSWATAINDAGQVVGEADNEYTYSAFLYTNGQMYDLGNLGDAYSYSLASDINAHGHVVGLSELSEEAGWANRAFLYIGTPGVDGQMIDLDAWLDQVNPVEGAKWTLESAYAINDLGLIVGRGWYDDGVVSGQAAFLLDASSFVPEPAGLSLIAIGALGLRRRRRTA